MTVGHIKGQFYKSRVALLHTNLDRIRRGLTNWLKTRPFTRHMLLLEGRKAKALPKAWQTDVRLDTHSYGVASSQIKRQPSNGQQNPLPCCTYFRFPKFVKQGRGYRWPLLDLGRLHCYQVADDHNYSCLYLVCAVGAITAGPLIYAALLMVEEHVVIFWILLVLILIALCLNWAVIVDIVTYVVHAQYRSTAVGVQMLMSHLLGKTLFQNRINNAI